MGGSNLAHTRWDCSYHIIFIPKFRRKVFFKEIRIVYHTNKKTGIPYAYENKARWDKKKSSPDQNENSSVR